MRIVDPSRITIHALLIGALLAIAGGCQSHTEGVDVWCNAPRDCTDCRGGNQRLNDLHRHVDGELSSGETRALFASMAGMPPSGRAAALEAEAQRQGIRSCPMTDVYREIGALPPVE